MEMRTKIKMHVPTHPLMFVRYALHTQAHTMEMQIKQRHKDMQSGFIFINNLWMSA